MLHTAYDAFVNQVARQYGILPLCRVDIAIQRYFVWSARFVVA